MTAPRIGLALGGGVARGWAHIGVLHRLTEIGLVPDLVCGTSMGALVGSFLIGFLYNFGQAMFPDLAYVILFLPMLLILVLRPQGLFGRVVS